MKYELIIFDMDGTILNTLDDLKNSLNHALALSDMPVKELEDVRKIVGNGIRKMIECATPKGTDAAQEDKIYEDFMEHYQVHCADLTRPYEGIVALLQILKEKNYKTAVVSNKADDAVQDLCNQYFKDLFDCAVGEQAEIAKKPAPDMANMVLKTLDIPREKAVYIGDSEVDIATAKNSGLDAIIVEWGFRDKDFLKEHGADIIVSSPQEILSLV